MKIYVNVRKVDEDTNELKKLDENQLNSLKEGDFIWLVGEHCPVRFIGRRVGDGTNIYERYDVVDFFRIDGYSCMNGEIEKEIMHTYRIKAKVTPEELLEYRKFLLKMADFFKPCV